MKLFLKRLVLPGVLLVSLMVNFTSCSSKSSGEKTKDVELVFWHGIESPDSVKILKEKIKLFESKNPGITVKAQNYGAADQVNSKIMTAVAGNKAPDLFWYGNMAAGQFAKTGKLVKIQDLIKNDNSFEMEDIYTGLWDSTKYRGEIYAVPFAANNLALYYNKKHFKEAGINPGSIKTWDDLLTAAGKLTNKSRFGFQVPLGNGEWTVWTWQTLLWQAGGEFLSSPGNDKVLFDSKAGVAALQFWVDLVHKYKVANFSEPGSGYKIDQFVAGKISMMINGPWNLGALEKAKEESGFSYGAIILPKAGKYAVDGKGRNATNIGGEDLYLFKSGKDREAAAWKFAKFCMSSEFQVDWAMKTGYLPVSKSAANSSKYKKFMEKNDFIKTYSDQMEYGKARPAVPQYSKISSRLGKELEKALYKKSTPGKALNEAAAYAKRQLIR